MNRLGASVGIDDRQQFAKPGRMVVVTVGDEDRVDVAKLDPRLQQAPPSKA